MTCEDCCYYQREGLDTFYCLELEVNYDMQYTSICHLFQKRKSLLDRILGL